MPTNPSVHPIVDVLRTLTDQIAQATDPPADFRQQWAGPLAAILPETTRLLTPTPGKLELSWGVSGKPPVGFVEVRWGAQRNRLSVAESGEMGFNFLAASMEANYDALFLAWQFAQPGMNAMLALELLGRFQQFRQDERRRLEAAEADHEGNPEALAQAISDLFDWRQYEADLAAAQQATPPPAAPAPPAEEPLRIMSGLLRPPEGG